MEWTFVSPGKKRSQLGMLALQKEKPKSIIRSGVYRPKQLKFADDLIYTACVGYSRPKVSVTGEENAESVVAKTDVLVTATSSSTVGPCIETNSSDMLLNHEKDDAFENMIDEMAFNFWTCSKCLSLGHVTNDCKSQIRCKACYRYGHIKKNCLNSNRKGKQCWVPKRVGPRQVNIDTTDSAAVSPPLTSSQSASRHNPTTPNLQPPSPMAVYEIDPTPWIPNGQHVLDGGPTRLPRTFYTPSETPPRRHEAFCIAYVEPAQQATNQQLRDQVRAFLENQMRLGVEDFQPFLFGIGLLQLRSAAARFALVNHEPFEFMPDVFVRFTNHEDGEYQRGFQGFRTGWLMLLGVPLDYRNDFDVSNAIGTFGKFHDWHRDDPLLAQTLVHASFPSPQLVPRDIVFGDYAQFGGARRSWTACCFILSADFADIVPADEDPMPLDGNPHPLPGNLFIDHHNFVMPQYPEIGWNDIPQDPVPEEEAHPLQQMEQVQVIVQQDEVVNHSSAILQSSAGSVSSEDMVVEQPFVQQQVAKNLERAIVPYVPLQIVPLNSFPGNFSELTDHEISPVFGPVLPPEMIFMKMLEPLMPELLSKHIPLSLQVPVVNSIALSKRSWSIAFDQEAGCQIEWLGGDDNDSDRPRRSVARRLRFV
jgi:hypothetical protein